MTDKRKDITKLIEKFHVDNKLTDKLCPPAFTNMAAKFLSQNQALAEAQMNLSQKIVGRFRDKFNYINSLGAEAKKINSLIDTSAIEKLRHSVSYLSIDKGYLVTTPSFTKAAKKLAGQHIWTQKLINRSTLSSLIDQYTTNRELFASNLLKKAWNLNLDSRALISNPTPEDIEEFDIDAHELGKEEKNALITVDRLPLRLIAKILKSPSEVKNITPRQFEEFVAEILSQLGFTDVILTPRSRDGGKDVIASNQINGIPLSFYFECKKYADNNKVQLDTIRALLGTIAHDARQVNKGVLVTTSTLTKGCWKFILAESRLDGKDYDGILGWIDELNKKCKTPINKPPHKTVSRPY